ncbi:O-antigen ligase family protein [Brucella tritici]|uniref:O-antigen ligase family protein n=1 Tax=Brucella tritici TaxID=94626 RepID=A0A7V8B2V8_9HYPH|nr:O-antigen ligase [Brucella tritici]KAB2657315.1 O-antigen ligase family protein [Brucella tritici]
MSRTYRNILFIGIFCLYWITLSPFIDLRNPDVLLAQEAGNVMQQVLSLLLTALSLAVLWQNRNLVGKVLFPYLVMLLGWQFITVILSTQPDLSFRRYIFSVTVVITALAWLLLPEDENHFIRLINPLSLFVLGLSYFGVIFLPAVSIHNLAEVLELTNAGSWRGHFAHKNIAGPAMVVLSCYGMYLWRSKARLSGTLITILALFFLYKTNNKTSIGLVVLAFTLAYCLLRTRSLAVKALMVYVPLLITAYLTLGTVLFPSAKSLVESFASDPTFTGRTEIWKFAIRQLMDHPLVGYGYDAFWGTSRLVNGGYDIETWAARAGHAHNAYLNITITTGFIGLAALIWWIGVCPLLDFHRAQRSGNSSSLALMYLQIWLFIMFYANLETPFFVARGPVWFSVLTAVMGLRLHACTMHKKSATAISQIYQREPNLA